MKESCSGIFRGRADEGRGWIDGPDWRRRAGLDRGVPDRCRGMGTRHVLRGMEWWWRCRHEGGAEDGLALIGGGKRAA